jgi:hypothetical protein
LILTNPDVRVEVNHNDYHGTDRTLGIIKDFQAGDLCLQERNNICTECLSSSMVPLYMDNTPEATCIEVSACVSTATQLYTYHSDANVCSTSPTTPFCKEENSTGCTVCLPGYYLEIPSPGVPGVCKFINDTFPNCRLVENMQCLACLHEFTLDTDNFTCSPTPGSDYSADKAVVNAANDLCSGILPGCAECERIDYYDYICLKC